jgi:hypothetical protein
MAAIYGNLVSMSRRFKTTIYLDSLQYRRLKEIGEQQGATAAEQIREAIDQYLTRHSDRREPRSLASGSSGRGDLSENAEELLRGFGRR